MCCRSYKRLYAGLFVCFDFIRSVYILNCLGISIINCDKVNSLPYVMVFSPNTNNSEYNQRIHDNFIQSEDIHRQCIDSSQ